MSATVMRDNMPPTAAQETIPAASRIVPPATVPAASCIAPVFVNAVRPVAVARVATPLNHASAAGPALRRTSHSEVAPALAAEVDVKPWLDAASRFEMNIDFDWSASVPDRSCTDLPALMQAMKDESFGKRTIQALADKLMLHRIVKNLGIAQMPVQLAAERSVAAKDVESLVDTHLSTRGKGIVLKPSHLSNGSGFITVSTPMPHERQPTVDFLIGHIAQFLAQQADAKESVALRTLRPGFVAQPQYKSVIGFRLPLELRVQVLWGRARTALWWWGRAVPESTRNAWFVRRFVGNPPDFGQEDVWEVIHDHPGHNKGFTKALELFMRHIREMTAAAEHIAVAVGAPFLRADFFVGSPEWGVRLNEVAYGCGADYRNITAGKGHRVIDDAPTIAHILREGMSRCKKRLRPDHFLSRLGVRGSSYADMAIVDVPVPSQPMLPEGIGTQCEEFAVTEDQCSTPRSTDKRPPAALAPAAAVSANGFDAARPAALSGRRIGSTSWATKAAESTSSSPFVHSYRGIRVYSDPTRDRRASRPLPLDSFGAASPSSDHRALRPFPLDSFGAASPSSDHRALRPLPLESFGAAAPSSVRSFGATCPSPSSMRRPCQVRVATAIPCRHPATTFSIPCVILV
jgi:hypothetical protein